MGKGFPSEFTSFLNHPSPLRQRVLKCRFGSYYYRSIYISLYSIWFIFPRDPKNVNVEVYQVFKRPMLSDDQESLNNQELPVSCSVICYEILTLKSHFPCFCETLQWCSGAVVPCCVSRKNFEGAKTIFTSSHY